MTQSFPRMQVLKQRFLTHVLLPLPNHGLYKYQRMALGCLCGLLSFMSALALGSGWRYGAARESAIFTSMGRHPGESTVG